MILEGFFESVGLSYRAGLFILFLVLMHVAVAVYLFVRTREKADKWKVRRKQVQRMRRAE
jgi:uncharacterized protein HemY